MHRGEDETIPTTLGAQSLSLRYHFLTNLFYEEKAVMKINTPVMLRAGLIGAAVAIVFGILVSVIPTLVYLTFWMGAVINLATGALYVHLTPRKGGLAEGAVGGAIAGVVAGVIYAPVVNLFNIIVYSAAFGSLISGVLREVVAGAVLGAVGGLVYAARFLEE
jgi:hypothetical protein